MLRFPTHPARRTEIVEESRKLVAPAKGMQEEAER